MAQSPVGTSVLSERGNRRTRPLPARFTKLSVFVAVVRRSGPRIVEATLIPAALFYCFLVLVGLGAAFAAALIWTYAAISCRLVRRQPIPPLLVLGVIGVTSRTLLAVASGSTFVYFAQPILVAVVMAGVFFVSVIVGRPLVERLALEFWPLTPEAMARPAVARLFRRLTFLWAALNLASAATNLALFMSLRLATFVAVKQVASLAITGTGVALTIDWSLRIARREGLVPSVPTPSPGATVALVLG